MHRALGMVEFSTVIKGIEAMDNMIKTANVRILQSHTLCPGRYILLIQGELSAVKASMSYCDTHYTSYIRKKFVLGNPHDQLIHVLGNNKVDIPKEAAMGMLETNNIPAVLKSADECVKSAEVRIVKLMLGQHIGGKGVLVIAGEVAGVEEAIQHACIICEEEKSIVDFTIIPRPDPITWEQV